MSDEQRACSFERAIFLKIEGRWHVIDNGERALRCLEQSFPDRSGPSHRRATAANRDYVDGKGSREAAESTFVVAAMEAELIFEVLDDDIAAMERRVAITAENGLLDMLVGLDEAGG